MDGTEPDPLYDSADGPSLRPPVQYAWSSLPSEHNKEPPLYLDSVVASDNTRMPLLEPAFNARSGSSQALKELAKSNKLGAADRYQPSIKEVEEMLLQRVARNHAVLDQARTGDVDALKLAVEQEVDLNYTGAFKETALSLAAEFGHLACARLLIERGANLDVIDARHETALSLSAKQLHKDIVKALVRAGADVQQAIRVVTNISAGINLPALELLTSWEILYCAPMPIMTAFGLGTLLKHLSISQPERQSDYLRLQTHCEQSAVRLLDCCENLWEVRRVMQKSTKVLDTALFHEQKAFVAHPNTQALLRERWVGDYLACAGVDWIQLCLYYLLAFVLLPIKMLQFYSQRRRVLAYSDFGDYLRLCQTPYFKFFGSIVSYMVFLSLVIATVAQQSTREPTGLELAVAVWVLSLIFGEVIEVRSIGSSQYFHSYWNRMDLVMLLGYIAVIVLRAVAWTSDAYSENALFVANMVFAFCATVTCARLLNVFQTSSSLGPLLLTIFRVLKDLYRFGAVLLVFILAFSMGLSKVYQTRDSTQDNSDADSALGSLPHALRWLFFSLFGFGDLVSLEVFGHNQLAIRSIGQILFGVYIIIVFILLLNLLIAMINQTYQVVQDNSDVEWKFLRARLTREFEESSAIPAPLNLLGEPLAVILRTIGLNTDLRSTAQRDAAAIKEEAVQLRMLFRKLVDRYEISCAAKDEQERVGDIAALRQEVLRLSSLLGDVATRIGAISVK